MPGSHMRDSEPVFGDQDLCSTQVTPTYWVRDLLAWPHIELSNCQSETWWPSGWSTTTTSLKPHRAAIPDQFFVTVSDFRFSTSESEQRKKNWLLLMKYSDILTWEKTKFLHFSSENQSILGGGKN